VVKLFCYVLLYLQGFGKEELKNHMKISTSWVCLKF